MGQGPFNLNKAHNIMHELRQDISKAYDITSRPEAFVLARI